MIGTWTERGGQQRVQRTRQEGLYSIGKGTDGGGWMCVHERRLKAVHFDTVQSGPLPLSEQPWGD